MVADVMASARAEGHELESAATLADDVFEVASITFVETVEA